jgi:hypothetical protein
MGGGERVRRMALAVREVGPFRGVNSSGAPGRAVDSRDGTICAYLIPGAWHRSYVAGASSRAVPLLVNGPPSWSRGTDAVGDGNDAAVDEVPADGRR